MIKSIVRKVFVNSKTQQVSITLPKKLLKALNPNFNLTKDSLVEVRLKEK